MSGSCLEEDTRRRGVLNKNRRHKKRLIEKPSVKHDANVYTRIYSLFNRDAFVRFLVTGKNKSRRSRFRVGRRLQPKQINS